MVSGDTEKMLNGKPGRGTGTIREIISRGEKGMNPFNNRERL